MLRWARLVITHFFAFTGTPVYEDRVLHRRLPDELWIHIRNFLDSLSHLPCWIDKNLSTTVFGPKQNLDYWEKVFETGRAPGDVRILTSPLDLRQMIQGPNAHCGGH